MALKHFLAVAQDSAHQGLPEGMNNAQISCLFSEAPVIAITSGNCDDDQIKKKNDSGQIVCDSRGRRCLVASCSLSGNLFIRIKTS